MDNNTAFVPNVAEAAADVAASEYTPPVIPDLSGNYAEDPDVVEFIKGNLYPVLWWTRSQRAQLEDEWERVRNMVTLHHDEGQRYLGRSNAYVPSYSQARKALVSQLARGLFPSDEYMSVEGQEGVPEEDVRAALKLMKNQLEQSANMRHGIKPLLRQKVDYGTTVGKLWYSGPEENLKRVRRNPATQLQSLMYEAGERPNMCEGLKFEARNLFFWYIYPTTASSLAEAQVVFEDILIPLTTIREKCHKGQWLNKDVAENAPTPPQYNANLQRLLQAQADLAGTPESNPVGGSEIGALRVATEVWVAMPLPRKAYAANEEVGTYVPCKVVMCGDVPVEVRRNPFWDQTPPYLVARSEWEVGSFYTRGEGHKAMGIQYLVNDFSNQLNDNGTYALNPIVMTNPSLFTGPISPLRPGGMWQGTDVEGMAKFDRPPVEQLNYGLMLAQHYDSMLENKIGAPPIIQGTGTGKGSKTATASQTLQRNAMNPLQDEVEDLENSVMMPTLFKGWAYIQQYMRASKMRAICGSDLKVSRDVLDRDYMMRWMASSQAANQQMRAQQIMQLFQTVMTPVMMQLVAAQKRTFNPIPWLKRLASDGFGLRGFEEAFPMLQIPNIGQPGMMPGGPQLPPIGGAPGQRVRSTVEQANGEGVPTNASPVPGEGDDFMAVREQADAAAGLLGGEQ